MIGSGASARERGIRERAAFHFIRYASVWEDADTLCEALGPQTGGRLLSISSAGDNALALLTLDPAEVVAVDLSGPQLAALALRIVAFHNLADDDLLAFLGVDPSNMRLEVYEAIRGGLPREAMAFWDSHPSAVAAGIIHAGKFERYLRVFGARVLPLIHDRRRIRALMEQPDLRAQEDFFQKEWDTWRWRLLFRVFFSRAVMGRLGRDPAFFDHVEGSVASRIMSRTRHALTRIPTGRNPYLTYILTGNFLRAALPRYLRPEFTPIIRERLHRIRMVEGSVEETEGSFTGFNLSDIFEYMGEAQHRRTYSALVDRARPGARLAYWNLLAPRTAPAVLRDRVRPLREVAEELHARDQAWFYQDFNLDEVIQAPAMRSGGGVREK
jgi:S-adenosylmethionine-diacylglycerol 3-amino-3-carboxypropyl transferase